VNLVKKKIKAAKLIFISGLILGLILCVTIIFSIGGCGKPAIEEAPEDIEEPVEEVTIEEETGEEIEEEEATEEVKEVSGTEITGNINILSGLEISDSVKNYRPIAVMIENHTASRPQSGLHLADVVFEVVDEGGITRYVAVYSSYEAEIMAPIRSARQYYAEIARSFDPIYAFWGTYPECYPIIESMDLDVLDGNSEVLAYAPSGWRDSSRHSALEHTACMSTVKLKEDAENYGYSLEGGLSPFRFKLDSVKSERGNISYITVDFSTDQFKIDFEYDIDNNNYIKYLAGSPHKDRETEEQITLNNVIVMISDIANSGDAAGHMVVRTTQSGKAYYFLDGNVIEGSWERNSIFEPFTYKDDDGKIVLFNRGSTWVSIIPSIDRLTY
jgi:hypothetical protein